MLDRGFRFSYSANLKNYGISLGKTPINLLDKDAVPPILSENYKVALPAYGYLILGVPNED